MKVCHLASGDLWAGAEVQIFNMIRSLNTHEDLNLSAIILNHGKLTRELEKIGIEVAIFDESKHSFSELRRMIAKRLKDSPVDIVHSHRLKENILAGLMKRAGLVNSLVKTVHGLPEPASFLPGIKTRLYRSLENYFTRRYFSKTLPVSNDICQTLAHTLGGKRLRTIHNAIDPEQLKINKSPEQIKTELGLEPQTILIGSAGRMVPVKGYNRFITTAQMIVEKLPKARFILAGDGPILESLKDQAISAGLAKQIIFTGFRDDIIDLVNSFDLFLVTSYHEGIPMVVLEAMALGIVVVAFDVGGLGEIMISEESGVLVEPGDIGALAQASLQLLDNNDRRNRIALTAKARIEECFSARRQRQELKDIYEMVIAES